jgi:hypothetical protein
MSAADRTSKLLDKLQQVEAIGEGARQAMRQENVDLAAHEEELLEEVQLHPPVSHFSSVPAQRPPPPADESSAHRYFLQGQALLHASAASRPMLTMPSRLISWCVPRSASKNLRKALLRPTTSTSGRCEALCAFICKPASHVCRALLTTLMQMFSLREHLLTVEKQRDMKAADAAAWAARVQEVQDECNNQMSYQQIEIQVCLHAQNIVCCPRPVSHLAPAGSASARARSRPRAASAVFLLLLLLQLS